MGMRHRVFAAATAVALLLLVAGQPRADEAFDNPRAAMLGYLQACIDGDCEGAARFLDLRRVASRPVTQSPTLGMR